MLKTLYSPNYDIFVEKECIVMCDKGSSGSHISHISLSLVNNELEFRITSTPLGCIFKFMGSVKSSLEIIRSDFTEFIMKTRYYSTYAAMR